MPNCFWKVVKSYCLQEHNTLNIESLSYCFFFLHLYLQLVCFKIFQMEGDLLLQLEAHNYYQGSASRGGDIPYQCRANPPNPLFLSDRCITIRIGTPHHISPPTAKSAFPINTRTSTATVALYFTTVLFNRPANDQSEKHILNLYLRIINIIFVARKT